MKLIRILMTALALYTLAVVVDVWQAPKTTVSDTAAAAVYLAQTGLPIPTEAFHHDGCTAWPDTLPGGYDFRAACLQHDIAYWAGGDEVLKKRADTALRTAIADGTFFGDAISTIMYQGVTRLGNNAVSDRLDSEWGYGWD